ncbi:VWA domain-containing protein [Devosia limi]|uniref:Ca-activated chloride channel family protein n=1 Tax=Devosia limi DSM 17137 TaxID=1121477 RepID=A0A1M4V775_9HYPH|nr:Ca-activated chloride channel family protein [Devosia limi DSM 17137]
MKRLLGTLIFAAFTLAGLAGGALSQERMIIVMDGSGSMWGQIEGRAKLEIARDTVAEVLRGLPDERELGLIAYGHRQKGDCSDIELVVPASSNSAGAILDAVNSMRFLGKTPLTQAVREAAEALHYTEDQATVVLVTDGLETCEADPCALGKELAELGLNFTAHVVGFGLSREEGTAVSCLAENTGGRYIQASNARDLAAALNATVYGRTQPVPEPTSAPIAGLTAPDEAPIGSEIEVHWSVTDMVALDTIEIGAIGGEDHFAYVYASVGNPVSIQAPGEPGAYELRYVSADQHVVARRPITVTEAPVSLSAPDQAIAGQIVPVHWVGPDAAYDNIRVRLPGDDSYLAYAYVSDNNPVILSMPEKPGTYELTYVLNDTDTIAIRPIVVVPAGTSIPALPASLSAPLETEADSDVQVGWSGPGAADDYIMLRLPGSDSYVSYGYVRGNNPVTLATPSEPGDYELVYRFADGRELAQRSIGIVTAISASQADPVMDVTFATPAAYADLPVQWSAVPLPGQSLAPEAWAMNDHTIGPVTGSFEPGVYDVRGEGSGMTFTARVTVRSGAENHFVIAPATAAPPSAGKLKLEVAPPEREGMGEDTGYVCELAVPCPQNDPRSGLSFLLPAGWRTDIPIFYETAAGVGADVPSMTIFGPPQGAEIAEIVLNPRQWLAMNGPCVEVAMGLLCRFDTDEPANLAAFEILKTSLRFSQSRRS